jgi:hypothetical protein
MVDGSLKNKGLLLNTYNFTNEEVLNLKRTFENMFVDIANKSLNCSIHKHYKGLRIYVWEESIGMIREQILQLFIRICFTK